MSGCLITDLTTACTNLSILGNLVNKVKIEVKYFEQYSGYHVSKQAVNSML